MIMSDLEYDFSEEEVVDEAGRLSAGDLTLNERLTASGVQMSAGSSFKDMS